MENRIKKYVDELFEGIYINRQLQDMKEEIRVNLLEKVNDYINAGDSETVAFEKAVANLGDMNELLDGLKKASEEKMEANLYDKPVLPKSHISGYISGSALFLLGFFAAGFILLQDNDWFTAGVVFSVFFVLSSGVFTYFGLTQETHEMFPMERKRAFAYSGATVVMLAGGAISLFEYLHNMMLGRALVYLAVFVIPATILFIYLGLSEKGRSKLNVMDTEWQKNWVNKYANARNRKMKDMLSGAIWVFAAAFFMLGILLGFHFAWLVFLFAVGFQILLEAYFAAKV